MPEWSNGTDSKSVVSAMAPRVQIPIFPPYIEKPRKSMVYGAFSFPVLPSISTQCSGLYGTVLVPDPKLPPWHPKSVSNQTSICGAPAPIPSRRGSGRASSASGIGLSKGGGRVACCCGKTPNTRPFVLVRASSAAVLRSVHRLHTLCAIWLVIAVTMRSPPNVTDARGIRPVSWKRWFTSVKKRCVTVQ